MEGPRTILHADMDAFYAAIEQRDDPSLRGKPVIIGGLGNRGVVSTASYEARRFGVHSAMPTAVARRLCPDGIYLVPRMQAYAEASRAIQSIFREFTPSVEPLSLDEAFLDVSGSRLLFGDGVAIAKQIKERVRAATDLTVSIGVATTKFVAKVASDLEKPDGLVVVTPGDEERFLAPLPVKRLWGAGKVTQQKLKQLGLTTIGDVQALGEATLIATLGDASGRHFHSIAHGRDPRRVVSGRGARSISHETTFGTDVTSTDKCHAVLLQLSEGVGSRLRKAGLEGWIVRLKLRYPPFRTLTRQTKLDHPTSDDMLIYRKVVALLDAVRPATQPVRLLGVGVSDLVEKGEAGGQRGLFDAPLREDAKVQSAIDAIRERFGSSAIRRAATESPNPVEPEAEEP